MGKSKFLRRLAYCLNKESCVIETCDYYKKGKCSSGVDGFKRETKEICENIEMIYCIRDFKDLNNFCEGGCEDCIFFENICDGLGTHGF